MKGMIEEHRMQFRVVQMYGVCAQEAVDSVTVESNTGNVLIISSRGVLFWGRDIILDDKLYKDSDLGSGKGFGRPWCCLV